MVSSFSKITECPIVELQEDIASYLIDYFSLLARVTCDEKLSLPSEMTEVCGQVGNIAATPQYYGQAGDRT